MTSVVKEEQNARSSPARVLIVDNDAPILDLARQSLADCGDIALVTAENVHEAQAILASQPVDLLVTDLLLPDGNGLQLIREAKTISPGATSMVISSIPSPQNTIGAFRDGAVDFIPKPFTPDELSKRVHDAIDRHRKIQRDQSRLKTLKSAVRKLNSARKKVGRKVDLLCNDLIGAYSELSKQMDGVRLQQSYKQFISNCTTLEQLLCHSMDWLLREIGYSNIGIWLTTSQQELQLGAYMKYTLAAEQPFIDALQKNLLPMGIRRGFLHLLEPQGKSGLTPIEAQYLSTHDVVVASCTYLGETLGVLLLFRDKKTPFADADLSAIRAFSPLFALSLANAVRGDNPAGNLADEDAPDASDDGALGDESKGKPKKNDPADWWKRGETPPF